MFLVYCIDEKFVLDWAPSTTIYCFFFFFLLACWLLWWDPIFDPAKLRLAVLFLFLFVVVGIIRMQELLFYSLNSSRLWLLSSIMSWVVVVIIFCGEWQNIKSFLFPQPLIISRPLPYSSYWPIAASDSSSCSLVPSI